MPRQTAGTLLSVLLYAQALLAFGGLCTVLIGHHPEAVSLAFLQGSETAIR